MFENNFVLIIEDLKAAIYLWKLQKINYLAHVMYKTIINFDIVFGAKLFNIFNSIKCTLGICKNTYLYNSK